jgi:hypothetical protein
MDLAHLAEHRRQVLTRKGQCVYGSERAGDPCSVTSEWIDNNASMLSPKKTLSSSRPVVRPRSA